MYVHVTNQNYSIYPSFVPVAIDEWNAIQMEIRHSGIVSLLDSSQTLRNTLQRTFS